MKFFEKIKALVVNRFNRSNEPVNLFPELEDTDGVLDVDGGATIGGITLDEEFDWLQDEPIMI